MRAAEHEVREAIALHRRMNALIAEMATLPYGSVMNYNASGGGRSSETPGGRRPSGEHVSVEDEYVARWRACRTVRDGRECVEAAEECLNEWRHSKKVTIKEETWPQLAKRIRERGDGWSVEEVAQALKVSVTQVRKARIEGHLNPETGKEFHTTALPAHERKARVLELVRAGWRAKNVATELGVAYKTVLRDLDDAENAA